MQVRVGDASDMPAFHRAYVETAERDRFTPRGLEYFEHMYAVMAAEDPERIRVYLAEHEGDVLAATIWVRVGEHAWYSYGASTAAKRELQASTAIQWRMMRDSLAAGATVYDLRGITNTVDGGQPAHRADPLQGGHGRRGRAAGRRVGPAAEPLALQGFRPLHEAAVTRVPRPARRR